MKGAPVVNWAPRHECIWHVGGTAPRALKLGTTWDSVHFHAPAPLPTGSRRLESLRAGI